MGYYDWNGQMLPRASVNEVKNYLESLKQQFGITLHSLQEALPFAEFSYEDRKTEGEPEGIYSDVVDIQKDAIRYFEELIQRIDTSVSSVPAVPPSPASSGTEFLGLVNLTKEMLAAYGYSSEYFKPVKDQIRDYFIHNGYIASMQDVTDKGKDIGLQVVKRTDNGHTFDQLIFSEQAKQLIMPLIPQFKQNVDDGGVPASKSKDVYAEGYSPVFSKDIRFKKTFSGHTFTDDEVEKLLHGEEITILCTSKSGDRFEATGKIKYFENEWVYGKQVSFYRFCDEMMDTDPDWYNKKVNEYNTTTYTIFCDENQEMCPSQLLMTEVTSL